MRFPHEQISSYSGHISEESRVLAKVASLDWMIEANSTYRGWFVGGNQSGEWGNRSFVSARGAGHGELGSFFSTLLSGSLKMGDSPSVAYLLRDTRDDPTSPGVGRAVRACVGWPQDNLRSPDHSVGFG
jgi:hypothetical protein